MTLLEFQECQVLPPQDIAVQISRLPLVCIGTFNCNQANSMTLLVGCRCCQSRRCHYTLSK